MPLDLGSVIHAHTYTHTNTNAADTSAEEPLPLPALRTSAAKTERQSGERYDAHDSKCLCGHEHRQRPGQVHQAL